MCTSSRLKRAKLRCRKTAPKPYCYTKNSRIATDRITSVWVAIASLCCANALTLPRPRLLIKALLEKFLQLLFKHFTSQIRGDYFSFGINQHITRYKFDAKSVNQVAFPTF